MKIPLSQADLVPIAAKVSPQSRIQLYRKSIDSRHLLCMSVSCFSTFKLGFEYHHAQSDYVMMTKWLPVTQENTIPIYATHNIGELIT